MVIAMALLHEDGGCGVHCWLWIMMMTIQVDFVFTLSHDDVGDGDDTRWWQWHNLARNLLRFSTLMMFPREDSTNQGCSRHLNQNQYNKQVRVNISYQRRTFWDFSSEPGRVDPVISAFPEQARDEVFGLGRHRVELLVVKVVLGPEQEFILRSGSLSQSSKIWRFFSLLHWDIAQCSLLVFLLV